MDRPPVLAVRVGAPALREAYMGSHPTSFSNRARVIVLFLAVSGLSAAGATEPAPDDIGRSPHTRGREQRILESLWSDTFLSYLSWMLQIIGAPPDDIIKATTVQAKMNLVSCYYAEHGLPVELGDLERAGLIDDIRSLYEWLPLADVPLDPATVDLFKATLEKMWVNLGLPLSEL
jgi:hypothetical protein